MVQQYKDKIIAETRAPSARQANTGKRGGRDAETYPLSKELLLLWTMQAAHQPLFKDRGLRVNAVSPGPVTTPILKEFRQIFGDPRVDDDIARVGRPRGLGARHRARDPLSVLGRRALDQRRQSAGRRRPRSLDQRHRSRISARAGRAARRFETGGEN
jgi:NAD(P)-dependent dehydrogenase (short-subunit alcohol dehydrogenase family)